MSDRTFKDEQKLYVSRFETLTYEDVPEVGGKNASLGEMTTHLKKQGIHVPPGFAITADAYREFIYVNGLGNAIEEVIAAWEKGRCALSDAGARIRHLIYSGEFPLEVKDQIAGGYSALCSEYDVDTLDVAVRSSGTAEDLPEASFAGQQETYLNIRGIEQVLDACKKCYASLFTDRAISYRSNQGFDHTSIALSVGVQKMVQADKAGVLFTIDTETGFPNIIVIEASWGLGEVVVQGSVTPDHYKVFKPFLSNQKLRPIIDKRCGDKKQKIIYANSVSKPTKKVETSIRERSEFVLSDEDVLKLGRLGESIERHYGRPMDVEWAHDGDLDEFFVVQARPETVQSRATTKVITRYRLLESGHRLVSGLSIGNSIARGKACLLDSPEEVGDFKDGDILVTRTTDPDWGPIIKKAAGIVTDHGGRTSHAAIVSRELGIPAILGTGRATSAIKDGQDITVSCAEGDDGYVYDGLLDTESEEIDVATLPETQTRIMLNLASPSAALAWWRLPVKGIGLARMEYIINNVIQIHPLALVRFHLIREEPVRERIAHLTRGYDDKKAYFVDNLAWGISRIAASQYPEPVVVRLSDFKTNEYADLIGGRTFEPEEENPMLGWRGASRYYSAEYRDGFALECEAIRTVREDMGFTNVVVMVPFCRTPEEADKVLNVMSEEGLQRGENDLKVFVMAELPSNFIQASDFADRFDGFSVGSNDLTQLVLGVDRDSELLAELFDERQFSVRKLIDDLISRAHGVGLPVGICGQAPSDHAEFAGFLVEAGIDSISVTPDSVPGVIRTVAKAETQYGTNQTRLR